MGETGPAVTETRRWSAWYRTTPAPSRGVGAGPSLPPWRHVRRFAGIAAGLMLFAVVAQGAVSAAAARVAAAAITRALGGHVEVSVTALPFWELAQGRFQHFSVTARDVRDGSLSIARLDAEWSDGSVRMADLRAGRPMQKWVGGGRLDVHLFIRPDALLAALPPTGSLKITALELQPPGAWVVGRVRFGELDLPFRALGSPEVIDGGAVLVFRVTILHAGPLALRSSLGIPVVDLRQTPLNKVLWVEGARVGANGIDVELTNRPSR